MANKFPLVFDPLDRNRIKELPSGDNLNMIGSSIVDVVDINASGTLTIPTINVENLNITGSGIVDVAISGDYNDLVNKPTLFDGDYNSLTNKPVVFDGDYTNLTNKPIVADKTSQLLNDSNFISNATAAISVQQVIGISDVGRTGSYTDLVDSHQLVTQSQISDGTLTIDVNNTGDLEGNVLGTDGITLLVDADNNKITGNIHANVYANGGQLVLNRGTDGSDAIFYGASFGIHTGDVISGSIFADDSTQLLDSESGTHYGKFEGDLIGSVSGDDSSLLIDGVNSKVVGNLDADIIRTGNLTITSTGNISYSNLQNFYLYPQGPTLISGQDSITLTASIGDITLTASSGSVKFGSTLDTNGNTIKYLFILGADGTDHYTFSDDGNNWFPTSENDPVLYLRRGETYCFDNRSGAHPFQIQSTSGLGGTAYNTGVTNNNAIGQVTFTVPMSAPAILYYQCTAHANMGNTINIV